MSRQTEGYISKYSKGFETGPTNYACTNIELVTIDSRKHDDRIEFKTELPISSITNNEYFGVSPLNLLFFRTLSLLEDTESNQSQSWWHRKETIQVDCDFNIYFCSSFILLTALSLLGSRGGSVYPSQLHVSEGRV